MGCDVGISRCGGMGMGVGGEVLQNWVYHDVFKDNYQEFMIEVHEDCLHYRGKTTSCLWGVMLVYLGVGVWGWEGGGPAELGIPRCIQGQLSGIYDRIP